MLLPAAVQMAYNSYSKNKEGFANAYNDPVMRAKIMLAGFVALYVGTVVLSIWAAGTSWHCNSVQGRWFITKVLYAFLSSVVAPLYLLARAAAPGLFGCPTRLV